jgi:hypothetical protein
MMTTLSAPGHVEVVAEALATCPFSMAETYAHEYLHEAERHTEAAAVGMAWLPVALRPRVNLSFGVHVDVAERGRMHNELRVRWTPPVPIFPDFHGAVRFRISGTQTRVIVTGRYLPPGGPLGRLIDDLIGKRIAQATMRDLAERIARQLGVRHAAWSARAAD